MRRVKPYAALGGSATMVALQAETIAAQRLVIAEGDQETMCELEGPMTGVSEETILTMLMRTNHGDTIRDAAARLQRPRSV
jgi:hypothetical protein